MSNPISAFSPPPNTFQKNKLLHTNLFALHSYLQNLPVFTWASKVKLIHGWVPTYSLLHRQECSTSPLYPRCKQTVETNDHILICTAPDATQCWTRLLNDFIRALSNLGTPIYILTTFHYKLSILLNLHYDHAFSPSTTLSYESKALLMSAIRHQNILGWDSFLRGFTSIRQLQIIPHLSSGTQSTHRLMQQWDVKLIYHILSLYKKIWDDRNKSIHGTNHQESIHNERIRLLETVRNIYKTLPDSLNDTRKFIPFRFSTVFNTVTLSSNNGLIGFVIMPKSPNFYDIILNQIS